MSGIFNEVAEEAVKVGALLLLLDARFINQLATALETISRLAIVSERDLQLRNSVSIIRLRDKKKREDCNPNNRASLGLLIAMEHYRYKKKPRAFNLLIRDLDRWCLVIGQASICIGHLVLGIGLRQDDHFCGTLGDQSLQSEPAVSSLEGVNLELVASVISVNHERV